MYKGEEEIDEEGFEEDYDSPDTTQEESADSYDGDDLDELEEGFMQGYDEGERAAKCSLCKKLLGSVFVEEEIDDQIYRFCNEQHAEAFKRKHTEPTEE